MARMKVLVEIAAQREEAFAMHAAIAESAADAASMSEDLLSGMAGLGIEIEADAEPVPMFAGPTVASFSLFASPTVSPDAPSATMVVPAEVDTSQMDALRGRDNVVQVWPNSELTLFAARPLDLARSIGGLDCRPFREGVDIETIRELLGAEYLFEQGFRGQNVTVGIIDEGVNGDEYPVVGGFSRPNARMPGSAQVTSHGSMCAADVLIAAPWARIYDYPFLGVPNSGGMLQMMQAVLDQRRLDGTPQITNNSYGFTGIPSSLSFPTHEVHDRNHPVHRKVREVVASGAACFFAAGNCGQSCPSGNCHPSGIGPGKSIHASNGLAEVITVAAVNSRHERIGYSSQGPGMFEPAKPDIASYSHIFANFGPGRPGGTVQPFDNGTSAATPVAAGVGALLLSMLPDLTPAQLKEALMESAVDTGMPGQNAGDIGRGIINAAAAAGYARQRWG